MIKGGLLALLLCGKGLIGTVVDVPGSSVSLGVYRVCVGPPCQWESGGGGLAPPEGGNLHYTYETSTAPERETNFRNGTGAENGRRGWEEPVKGLTGVAGERGDEARGRPLWRMTRRRMVRGVDLTKTTTPVAMARKLFYVVHIRFVCMLHQAEYQPLFKAVCMQLERIAKEVFPHQKIYI
uniref:Uncharacterized protein n=1 Tax=Hordeum vulgare subsp. vulgare TaxID=112509 RepID=A0A023INH3_HORVV|nr:hypothetical protein [Hordeum vulgare subsp. vulgare]